MSSLTELKRRVASLQRRCHRELAIYRMRRVTEAIEQDYVRDLADRREPPRPLEIVRRISGRGFRLQTWGNLVAYLNQTRKDGEAPESRRMLLALLPWAWKTKYDRLLLHDLSIPRLAV